MHFLLWTKGSQENINFDIFKCSDENSLNSSCHFPNHKSVFLRILHDSSCHEIYSFVLFKVKRCMLCTKGINQSAIFLLFSAQIEFHQILVIFQTKNKFLFKFSTIFIVRIGVSTLIPPQKHHPPSFLPSSPLSWQTVQTPPLPQAISPSILVFREPPLKVGSFSESPKY